MIAATRFLSEIGFIYTYLGQVHTLLKPDDKTYKFKSLKTHKHFHKQTIDNKMVKKGNRERFYCGSTPPYIAEKLTC